MKNKQERSSGGFTLLETIVAVVLISIGLLTMAQLMVVAINMHEATESDIKSIQLAQAKLELLKAEFSQSILTGDHYDLTAGSHGPESLMIQTMEYDNQSHLYFDVTWSVVDLSGGQKQVTLTVNPTNYGGMGDAEGAVTITSVLSP